MATPKIEGTPLTIATVNDDWASKGTNLAMVVETLPGTTPGPKAADPGLEDCDLVMIQEGKRAKYRDLLDPKAYGVHQDTSTQARAGSVLVWRKHGEVRMTALGWTFLVHALGLLARYLAWGRADVGTGAHERAVFIGAAHRPPRRTARWWHPFDAALAARIRIARRFGRLVIVGIDANQVEPERLAKMCGLVWHSIQGRSIDGFLASPQIQFVDIRELPRDTSDHHPLVATVVIPKKRPRTKKIRKSPPAFEHVVYNGRLMDQKTKAFVQACEKRLKYPLTILQGCYNAGGVAASAGTHDGGGVVDLAPWDYAHKVHVVRSLGAFAWHRLPSQGPWGEHVHLGVRNHGRLSASAAQQQHYFDERPRRNGLAGEPVDPNQYPPIWPAPTFRYPPV